MTDEDQLGALVREFRTDIRRRRRTGSALLLIGAAIAALSVAILVRALITPGVHAVGPLALPGAVGLVAVASGVILRRGVPRSETIELHEGGLVRRTDRVTAVLPWHRIHYAEYRSPPLSGTYTPGKLAKRTGMDVHVLVWPVEGEHFRLTGHTAGAGDLVAVMRHHVPHANSPIRLRRALLLLLGIVAFVAGVTALAIWAE